jgi:hypothetical protein
MPALFAVTDVHYPPSGAVPTALPAPKTMPAAKIAVAPSNPMPMSAARIGVVEREDSARDDVRTAEDWRGLDLLGAVAPYTADGNTDSDCAATYVETSCFGTTVGVFAVAVA